MLAVTSGAASRLPKKSPLVVSLSNHE